VGSHNKFRYFKCFTYIVQPHAFDSSAWATDRFPGSCHVIRNG